MPPSTLDLDLDLDLDHPQATSMRTGLAYIVIETL
jgi:hypothetical protein